jgi:hypothetical protein
MDSATANIIAAIISGGAAVAVALITTFGINRRNKGPAESPHEVADPANPPQRPPRQIDIRGFIIWCLVAAFFLFEASHDLLTGDAHWQGSTMLALLFVGIVAYRLVRLLDSRLAP